MTKNLRILVLADGSSFHTERYIDALRSRNCDVLLATMESTNIAGSEVLYRKGPINQLHYALATTQVKKIINKFEPDIINSHFISGYGFMAARCKHIANIPIVHHLWGSDILIVPKKSPMHLWKIKFAISQADHIIGDSEYLLNETNKLKDINCPTSVIPWGLEKKYLDKLNIDHKNNEPLKVIVPRAHEEVYGNEFLLEILSPLVNDGEISLTFPEHGSLFEQFKSKADLLTDNKINFYKRSTRDEFINMLLSHDVYLSNSKSDSSPATLIEAIGLGLIPVVAEIDGVKEWINKDNGFTFEINNAAQLISIINDLKDKYEKLNSLRKENHELVKERAVFDDNIEQTISIFESLL